MSNSAKNKDLMPVYLIVGTDKLRRDAVLKRLNERMQEYGDMSFNSTQIDASSPTEELLTSSEIINACSTMPFASDKRYVQVNNADKLKKDDSDQLVTYLEAPSQTSVLVLVADKLAKNTRLHKAVAKIGPNCIIECEPPKAYELAANLQAVARSHNGSIAPDAAKKLIELIGTDTTALDSEIQRLLLATEDNNITLQHVLTNTSKTDSAKPWTLVNHFSARDVAQAITTLKSMDENTPYILLPMICNRVKELMYVQSLISAGQSVNQNAIAKELHMAPWQCKNHGSWARNFSAEELRVILYNALDCEAEIKSGADSQTRFEMFIVESLS